MYQSADTRNYADGALSLPSDSNNPDADWGPAAQDVRHRLFVMANFPLPYGLRVGLNMQLIVGAAVQHHDRPRRQRRHGVQRPAGGRRRATAARGAGQITADLRLTKSFNLGGLLGGGPEGVPMGSAPPPPPAGGGQRHAAWPGGPGGGGGDGPRWSSWKGRTRATGSTST